MSHFYASIQGNRGEATRQGTKQSGITGHIRGWNVGVEVECLVNERGEDVCWVYATHGSNGNGPRECIASVEKGKISYGLHKIPRNKRLHAINKAF